MQGKQLPKTFAFDAIAAPAAFEMTYTPTLMADARPVVVSFVKQMLDGETCYVGTAVNDTNQSTGGGTIILWASGTQPAGDRQFSHVLSGGNRGRLKGMRDRNRQFEAEKRRFVAEVAYRVRNLITAAEAIDELELLTESLSAAMKFSVGVVPGAMTRDQENELLLLGAPQYVVSILERREMHLVIHPEDVVSMYSQGHIDAVTGDWDTGAESVAWLRTMPCGVVMWLRNRRVKLRLVG